jgi:deazaflavin-dependent oxidoreductase (nitroreductase family)
MNSTTYSTTRTARTEHAHYLAPGWATRRIMNPIVSGLTKLGLPLKGSGVLSVRGRTTGEWRSVPVNPLGFEGERLLVAPRGETQWVRNLRAAGGGRLRQGRREEEFAAVELDDADKVPVLRAYLAKWAWEVGQFFDGVGADATDEELAAIAPRHPVFRIVEA